MHNIFKVDSSFKPVTSRAAPKILSCDNARYKAFWLTVPPRDMLHKIAEGFIKWNCASSTIFFVLLVNGQATHRKSQAGIISFSTGKNFAFTIFSFSGFRLRLWYKILHPKPKCARLAIASPMFPIPTIPTVDWLKSLPCGAQFLKTYIPK